MSDYITICRDAWRLCGLSGDGPADVKKDVGLHGSMCRWVAEGYQDVQKQHYNWAFLFADSTFSLKAGQARYAWDELGPEVNVLLAVRLLTPTGDVSDINPIQLDARSYFDFTSGTGRPGRFAVLPDRTWVLDRIPDDDYQLQCVYYRKPHVLGDNLDKLLIPEQHQTIVARRAQLAYGIYDEDQATIQDATRWYNYEMTRLESQFLPPLQFPVSPLLLDQGGQGYGALLPESMR